MSCFKVLLGKIKTPKQEIVWGFVFPLGSEDGGGGDSKVSTPQGGNVSSADFLLGGGVGLGDVDGIGVRLRLGLELGVGVLGGSNGNGVRIVEVAFLNLSIQPTFVRVFERHIEVELDTVFILEDRNRFARTHRAVVIG